MGNYLSEVGSNCLVIVNNKIMKMLIIGNCVKDNDGILHDYVGVDAEKGYNGNVYFFEHREIIDI